MTGGRTPAQAEFLSEMLDENPFADPNQWDGTPKWRNFDPPFKRATVSVFERRGWIETRGDGRHAEHRWTPLGHAEQLASRLRALGYRVARPIGVAENLRSPSPALPAGDEG